MSSPLTTPKPTASPAGFPTASPDPLLQTLAAHHPGGIGLLALLAALGSGWQPRTLQRRLAALIAQGRVERQGQARAARYRLAAVATGHTFEPAQTVQGPEVARGAYLAGQHSAPRRAPTSSTAYSPPAPAAPHLVAEPGTHNLQLSAEALQTQALVRRPRHLRTPVPYQLGFLEQYHPNRTPYLPPALCEQLRTMGQAPTAQQAPAGTFARDILNRLLIDLSWASSRLEGNTYSRLDTERLLNFGQAAEGKDALETQMVLNHKQAIEYLVQEAQTGQSLVNPPTLLALHALLSDGLMPDPFACGRLRRRPVEIGGSVYLPLALPQQVEEIFHFVVQMAAEITEPFEQAFFLMVHLPYLQPFEDVNKRVSRLAANIPLVQHNLSPLAFIDVPQNLYVEALLGVYELNRVDLLRDLFVWAYGRSCQQYVAIQQNLVTPDTFRLRHRQALAQVIAALIRQGAPATEAEIQARLPETLAPADHPRFTQLVLTEFASLHAGNVVRFGVGGLEWEGWVRRTTSA